jgi:replicative DNA helicase|tara:strand:+ start:1754 stop:3229 length:1476 start_codon:yes stop_codon:yes gene_type:complete
MPKKITKKLEDLAAERAVLSALCQYGLDAYLEIDFISSQSFTDPTNQLIFDCVYSSITENTQVELSSILSAANDLGVYDQINTKEEIGFIRSLFNFPIHKENVGVYAAKIAKLKLARELKRTLKACENDLSSITGDEDIMDIVAKIEEPLLEATGDIYQSSKKKTEVLGDGVQDHVQYLSENVSDFAGIPSGFSRFDEAIGGGLRRKCVDLVAARPKVGKSMFGDEVALHVAGELDIPVLMLDTEMSKEDHYNRILANLSGVEINRIATGRFSEKEIEKEKVFAAAEKLEKIPYHYISIAGESFENILSQMRKWIYQHVGFDENGQTKDCLIVYDYLKLMGSENISSAMQEYQVLGFQITKLHNFMVKYDVPCLSFVQLNRDGITRESTDVVSGSDRLIWLCTSFSIFKMKSDEEVATDGIDNGNRKLVPIVARHGAGLDDGDYVCMKMHGNFGRIEEGETRNEIHENDRNRKEGFETDENIDEESDIGNL